MALGLGRFTFHERGWSGSSELRVPGSSPIKQLGLWVVVFLGDAPWLRVLKVRKKTQLKHLPLFLSTSSWDPNLDFRKGNSVM